MLPSKLTPLGERMAVAEAQDQKKAIQKTQTLPFFAPMELAGSEEQIPIQGKHSLLVSLKLSGCGFNGVS